MSTPPLHLFVLAMLAGLTGQALEFTSFQFCYLVALYAAGIFMIARPLALLGLVLWAAGWGAPAATIVFLARWWVLSEPRRSLEVS